VRVGFYLVRQPRSNSGERFFPKLVADNHSNVCITILYLSCGSRQPTSIIIDKKVNK
jgi:hypothetical protein